MKKLTVVATALILILTLTGCTKSSSLEIQKRLIIQGLGFDKTDNGNILLSVQALNTENAAGTSGESAPDSLVKNYTVEGITVADCTEKLKALTGKNPLLSQNRIVVFSEKLAREGIAELIDSFMRNNENRFSVLTAVCTCSAEELICADLGENVVPARLLEQSIKRSGLYSLSTSVFDILNCLADGNKCAVLPVLSLSGNGKSMLPEISFAAVFKGDRLKSIKGADTLVGINYLSNSAETGKLSFTLPDGRAVSLEILNSRTKTSVGIYEGKPKFEIDIKTSLTLTEIRENPDGKQSLDDIEYIGRQAQNEIKKLVQNAVNECIIKDGADICGLSRRLWRTCPEYYRQHGEDAEALLGIGEYEIRINVDLLRAGDMAVTL